LCTEYSDRIGDDVGGLHPLVRPVVDAVVAIIRSHRKAALAARQVEAAPLEVQLDDALRNLRRGLQLRIEDIDAILSDGRIHERVDAARTAREASDETEVGGVAGTIVRRTDQGLVGVQVDVAE